MKFGPAMVDALLSALDHQLALAEAGSYSLVICGGSALAALGLVSRTTRDVDVLGAAEPDPGGLKVRRLPDLPAELAEAAGRVARDFGLDDDWLNLGPARQLELGLPAGFADRLVRRGYGDHFTAWFASRYDQVHFKLYAAVDRGDYHVQDLIALKPTDGELSAAARWMLPQDVSAAFRHSLVEFLEAQGWNNVARAL